MDYYYPSPSQLSSQPCYNPSSMMHNCGMRPFNPYQYYRADTGQSCTAVSQRPNTVTNFNPSLNNMPYPSVKDSLETLAAISSSIGSSPMLQKLSEGIPREKSRFSFQVDSSKDTRSPNNSKEKTLEGKPSKN